MVALVHCSRSFFLAREAVTQHAGSAALAQSPAPAAHRVSLGARTLLRTRRQRFARPAARGPHLTDAAVPLRHAASPGLPLSMTPARPTA